MSTSPTKRPTIAELEAILNDPNPGTISIAPDGSVHVLPSGMARESQAEVDSLRARLAAAEQKASEGEKLTAGCWAAVRERVRQISKEGWSAAHDAEHDGGELAKTAVCYALDSNFHWPWDFKWWKPSENHKRNIEKAAALLIAEWDRLDAAMRKGEG